MQNTGKIVTGIIIVFLVLGGIYYWYTHRSPVAPELDTAATTPGTDQSQPTLASGAATSDTALSQDLAGMDTNISAMTSDTAAIDQGMNDKQVPQDY